MNNPPATYYVIGLMSGSSLDGLDIAYCKFIKANQQWHYEILFAETVSYTNDWKIKLSHQTSWSAESLPLVDVEIATLWANEVKLFIHKNDIKNIDFIASHGHTIFHQPLKKYTTQIGCGATLAAISGYKTIYNFRNTDVALGGNGAPLVPIGDLHLFKSYAACLNLGGISNISIKNKNEIIAFDISACNQWLNKLANENGKEFDESGFMAQQGNFNQQLFDNLNQVAFYKQKSPKSLSNQYCTELYNNIIAPSTISIDDKLHTVTKHITYQINTALTQTQLQPENNFCLVTGGGAWNKFLIHQLSTNSKWKFIVPDAPTVNFKEALIFAFLGVLRQRHEINVLKQITGAIKDSCSGAIYL